jgi:hypothetical protein
MRKLLLVLFVAGLVVGLSTATPAPKNVKQPVLYFPTKVGTKWVYGLGDFQWAEVITKVEERNDILVVFVAREGSDGKVEPSSQVEVSKTGLRLVWIRVDQAALPHQLLKLPLKVEEEWSYDFCDNSVKGLAYLTAFSPEEVTVAAGTFEAIRVETAKFRQIGAGQCAPFPCQRATHWYAPGVGRVKISWLGSNSDYVLKYFSPAKD